MRILWNTTAFSPNYISTAVASADHNTNADYGSLGAVDHDIIGWREILQRYGPPSFPTDTE